MISSAFVSRRGVTGAIGAGMLAGAMLFGAAPTAFADPPPPPPGCSAGDYEQVKAEVSAATSVYMFTHPDVNAFFSSLKGQPRDQIRNQIQTYLNANPQTQSELAGIRQPMRDMKDRCQ